MGVTLISMGALRAEGKTKTNSEGAWDDAQLSRADSPETFPSSVFTTVKNIKFTGIHRSAPGSLMALTVSKRSFRDGCAGL